MNIGAAFNFNANPLCQHLTQPKSPPAFKDKPVYQGTQEQADAVAKQDIMVRKYFQPLGHGLINRQW